MSDGQRAEIEGGGRKLLLVEWLDAHSGRGWQTVDRIEEAAEPLYCRSVGWLFAEREDCIVVAPLLTGD